MSPRPLIASRLHSVAQGSECTYMHAWVNGTGKATPVQVWTGPEGSRGLRLPDFMTDRHMKVARLSALRTRRLYPYPFLLETVSAAGRIKSIKNSNDTVGD